MLFLEATVDYVEGAVKSVEVRLDELHANVDALLKRVADVNAMPQPGRQVDED